MRGSPSSSPCNLAVVITAPKTQSSLKNPLCTVNTWADDALPACYYGNLGRTQTVHQPTSAVECKASSPVRLGAVVVSLHIHIMCKTAERTCWLQGRIMGLTLASIDFLRVRAGPSMWEVW